LSALPKQEDSKVID